LTGAGHTDELFLLFDPPELPDLKVNDSIVRDTMTEKFTNFVKFG
jgi:hypothetical protein